MGSGPGAIGAVLDMETIVDANDDMDADASMGVAPEDGGGPRKRRPCALSSLADIGIVEAQVDKGSHQPVVTYVLVEMWSSWVIMTVAV